MEGENKKLKGISLRMVYVWLIVIAIIVFVLTMISAYFLASTFYSMSDASNEHIKLENAALELMEASDCLTENAQRFAVKGDRYFLDEYFNEAFKNSRREKAIETMSAAPKSRSALLKLQNAMDASVNLMNREYYSMCLVINAMGYTEYPDILKSIQLTKDDAALTKERKMDLALEMLLDDEYYAQKELIRSNMKESLHELETLAQNEETEALNHLHKELMIVGIMSIIQTLVILFMTALTSHLGIRPVLKAVDKIKADAPIPEIGANEFRYLARTYNKMYSIYKVSLECLNFKASHDQLTGAYNRSGYDLLLSTVDINSTHMILFDVDNFKNINDTYGHETGDQILKKVVHTLKRNFRNDDYICRIGGDEFVVFMSHSDKTMKDLIASKIERINHQLMDVSDGLPKISVSVGIVHGEDVTDSSKMFEKADEAMYRSKHNGKKTHTFYAT